MSSGIKEPDENSSIEECFQFYLNKSFTLQQLTQLSGYQKTEMRKCYFAGMATVLVVAKTNEGQGRILDQLQVFWKNEQERYSSENN